MKVWHIVVALLILGAVVNALNGESRPTQPSTPSEPSPPRFGPNICRHSGINTDFYMSDVHRWHIVCNDGATQEVK